MFNILGYEFLRIDPGSPWSDLLADWSNQCEAAGEDPTTYLDLPKQIYEPLVQEKKQSAGIYAVRRDGQFAGCLQANTAWLPKYPEPVLRVRHLTMCPTFDLTDVPESDYSGVLVAMMFGVTRLSNEGHGMKASYIHFHLRSPLEQSFFALLGRGMAENGLYESVEQRGAWLYIKKN